MRRQYGVISQGAQQYLTPEQQQALQGQERAINDAYVRGLVAAERYEEAEAFLADPDNAMAYDTRVRLLDDVQGVNEGRVQTAERMDLAHTIRRNSAAAAALQVPPGIGVNSLDPLIQAIGANLESGGDQHVTNQRSGAYGLFQFIRDTYNSIRSRYYIDVPYWGRGESAPSLGAADQWRLMRALTAENHQTLRRQLGRNPTGLELYGMHFLGGAAVTIATTAPEGDLMRAHMTAAQIRDNPEVAGWTVGHWRGVVRSRLGPLADRQMEAAAGQTSGRVTAWGDSRAINIGEALEGATWAREGAGFANGNLPPVPGNLLPGDVVIMSVGSNDIGMDPGEFEVQLAGAVQQVTEAGGIPVLVGIRADDEGSAELDQVIHDVAVLHGGGYIPDRTDLTTDGWHYDQDGAEAMVAAAMDAVSPLAAPAFVEPGPTQVELENWQIQQIGDPEAQAEVRSNVEHLREVDRGEERARREQYQRAAYDHVVNGGMLADLQPHVAHFLRRQEPEFWSRMQRLAGGTAAVTDAATYAELGRMWVDEPERFRNLNIMDYAGLLSASDFQVWADRVARAREGEDRNVGTYGTARTLARGYLRAEGIDTSPRAGISAARRLNQFHMRLYQEIDLFAENERRDPRPDEMVPMIQQLLMEVTLDPPGWGNSRDLRVFQLTEEHDLAHLEVPESEVAAITERFVAQFGEEPTAADVLHIYLEAHRMIRP